MRTRHMVMLAVVGLAAQALGQTNTAPPNSAAAESGYCECNGREIVVNVASQLSGDSCQSCTTSTGESCWVDQTRGVACGNSRRFTIDGDWKLKIVLDCGGDRVEFERTFHADQIELVSGKCETCYPTMCFPNATLRVYRCVRRIPIRWEIECDDVDVCRTRRCHRIPVEWRDEIYMTHEFDDGGSSYVGRRCDPNPGCPGCRPTTNPGNPTNPGAPNAQTSGTHVASVAQIEDAETEMNVFAPSYSLGIELARIAAGSGAARSVHSLTELNIYELGVLRTFVIEGSARLFARTGSTRVQLVGADGAVIDAPASEVLSAIEGARSSVLAAKSTYDINRDGNVDMLDLGLMLELEQASIRGEDWPRFADLDGDATISTADLCKVQQAVE